MHRDTSGFDLDWCSKKILGWADGLAAMGVSINGEPQISPKCLVYFMENPIRMDDLGVPSFQETPICEKM